MYFILNKAVNNYDTFKIQGWRRERKRCLKSELAFFQSSSRLIQLTFFVKCRRTLLSWIPNNHIQGQKEKENFVEACLRPPYYVESGIFTTKKCGARAALLFCVLNVFSFFGVLVAVAVLGSWSPYYMAYGVKYMTTQTKYLILSTPLLRQIKTVISSHFEWRHRNPPPPIVLFPDILTHYYDMLLTRGKINYFY